MKQPVRKSPRKTTGRDYAIRLIAEANLPGLKLRQPKGPPSSLQARDRALGEAVAGTVVRNFIFLRHLLKQFSGRDLRQIDPLVQAICLVALAQLRFLSRVPPSAAVDEAVEQTRRLGVRRASGFVNAVLRKATSPTPIVLPDRETNPEQFAHLVLSHPLTLYKKLLTLLGPTKALALAAKHNTLPPTLLRLTKGVSVADLADGSTGLKLLPHSAKNFFVVEGAVEADFARWSAAGRAQVQDPTSAAVVRYLHLRPGMRVLDRCCGVGTKTMQIAEQIGKDGKVIAVDPAKHRVDRLQHSVNVRGLSNVSAVVAGNTATLKKILATPEGASAEDFESFDAILVDVPCSNSGVLIRRPAARYRQDDASLRSLVALQRQILTDTMTVLRPGGRMVYSTCSIWAEENQDQVRWLLNEFKNLSLIEVQSTLPSLGEAPADHHDGGFVAVFVSTLPDEPHGSPAGTASTTLETDALPVDASEGKSG